MVTASKTIWRNATVSHDVACELKLIECLQYNSAIQHVSLCVRKSAQFFQYLCCVLSGAVDY